MESSLSTVKISQIEKMIDKIKKELNTEDAELTFEFFVASFYPDVFNNIKEALGREHALGYMEGLNENQTQ